MQDACNQLKDIANASPAVKLFAEWCEKAPTDPAWRGRFKVFFVVVLLLRLVLLLIILNIFYVWIFVRSSTLVRIWKS